MELPMELFNDLNIPGEELFIVSLYVAVLLG